MFQKTAYICGPLTELADGEKTRVKDFYEKIGVAYEEITCCQVLIGLIV
jgi:hypothetical protein